SCVNFANVLRRQQRAQDAVEWYSRAIPLLEANLTKDDRLPTERLYLRNAHRGRARALTDLKRPAEGLKDWDRAVELTEGADQTGVRLERAQTVARAGYHARAVLEAESLTRDPKAPGGTLYDAACVYGLSAAAVMMDADLLEQYAQKALKLLRRAQASGYFWEA